MNLFRLFASFRVRLLLVLAALLIATLGVQYYLNLRNARANRLFREQQQRALIAGVAVGAKGISSTESLVDIVPRNNPIFAPPNPRVTNIVIVDQQWRVIDDLDPKYFPKVNPDQTYQYFHLKDMTTLPPLMNDVGEDKKYFPSATLASDDDSPQEESHAFAVETEKGRWYVIVSLRSDRPTGFLQAIKPLGYTLVVLLAATFVAGILVWQFTRPIKDLSNAARR
ncbi:MAG TPA: hypothetical protein VEV81_08295, partial [Pyrinomonadaceae bacterium]|nr:hypothetical protein [Pyrinomonadaceae bacterium]